jgi:hypothetical protein
MTPGQRLLFHKDQPGMTAKDNEFRAVHSATTERRRRNPRICLMINETNQARPSQPI